MPFINKIILISVLLCGVHVFGLYHKLSSHLYDLMDFYFLIVAFFLVMIKYFTDKKSYDIPRVHIEFSKPLWILFFCLFLSSLSGYFYHEQSPFLTLLAMRYFAYFLVYYLLVMLRVKDEDIIKLVLVFAAFYMLVYSLQLLFYPMAIVPLGHVESFDRGVLRLRIEGVGFLTLAGFYCLNVFLVNKKKFVHFTFYILCFVFVYLLGFRTLLATYLLSSILLVSIYTGSLIKNVVFLSLLVLLGYVGYQVGGVNMYFSNMLDLTLSQVDKGDEYIRILTFKFLFEEVNRGVGSIIFGNGMPFSGTEYGNLVLGIGADKLGYISADLGLLGFVFNYGLLSLLAFLNVFRMAIFKDLPKNSVYLNVFFFYLLISSITTAEIFRAGMFVVEAVGLYLVTRVSYKKHILEHI